MRARQSRNLLATLLLSQGVPMLLAGDEIGRTQGGNNNAYCQDNATSWVDWNLDQARIRLLEFTRRLIRLRREHPVFRRKDFFQGQPLQGSLDSDIAWLKPDGTQMTSDEWNHDFARCLGVYLSGDALEEIDARGQPVRDESFLLLFNAHHDSIQFRLPHYGAIGWRILVDTDRDEGLLPDGTIEPLGVYVVSARTLVLLQRLVEST